jgi:hypothetical protein
MAWSLGDVIDNRPALSRWHPECRFVAIVYWVYANGSADKGVFEDFMASKLGLGGRSRSRGRPTDKLQQTSS